VQRHDSTANGSTFIVCKTLWVFFWTTPNSINSRGLNPLNPLLDSPHIQLYTGTRTHQDQSFSFILTLPTSHFISSSQSVLQRQDLCWLPCQTNRALTIHRCRTLMILLCFCLSYGPSSPLFFSHGDLYLATFTSPRTCHPMLSFAPFDLSIHSHFASAGMRPCTSVGNVRSSYTVDQYSSLGCFNILSNTQWAKCESGQETVVKSTCYQERFLTCSLWVVLHYHCIVLLLFVLLFYFYNFWSRL